MTDAAKEMLELAARIQGSLGPFNFITKAEREMVVAALRSAASAPSQTGTIPIYDEAAEPTPYLIEQFRKYGSASQAIVAGGVRNALEHARVRFECLADEFDKAGDNASWAMCSVDAEHMSRALALPAPEPQRTEES